MINLRVIWSKRNIKQLLLTARARLFSSDFLEAAY